MLRRAILVAALGFLAWNGQGWAQSSDPSFRVVNNTPNVVNEVYASPTSERNWGQDRLGDQVIAPGASSIIRMPADGNCSFDIRIVYQGGTAEERRNVNTCAMTDLVLGQPGGPAPRAQRNQQQGSTQQGNPSFNLVNQSGRVIEEFYASPSSQQNWGPDRLGDDVVQPNATFAVRLPQGECTYDIRIVFAGGQAQERRNMNACSLTNYTVR